MPRSHRCLCLLCLALGAALAALLLLCAPKTADAQPAAKGPVSFINDVAPILRENCFVCHDAKKRKGKLDMTTFESLRKGGTKEVDPISPGKPEESMLIDVLTTNDKSRMPPKENGDALPAAKIEVIRRWIKEGAKLDAGLTAKSDLTRELRVRWQPPPPPSPYKFPVTIKAMAFTPDGKKLVTAGNHELTVWDFAEGKLEKRIRTRAERAHAMVFLPDGKLVVAGERPGQEGDVRVYDVNAGTPKMENGVAILDGVNDKAVMVKHLLDCEDSVLCLDVSADGKRLVSGGWDRLVNVWDLSGGLANAKLEQTIENHADCVWGVCLAPDNQHLLTASRDKTAKVWDLKAKESVVTFPGHQQPVWGVTVALDSKTAISVGEDNQVRAFNMTGDGKQVRATGGHGKTIYKVVRSPKEPLVATCSADNTVRIWNITNGQNVRTLSGHTDYVYAVVFSPDGTLIASGAFNGEVRVCKVADGALVKAFNATPGLQTAEAPKK